jgi:hypothetical protein
MASSLLGILFIVGLCAFPFMVVSGFKRSAAKEKAREAALYSREK